MTRRWDGSATPNPQIHPRRSFFTWPIETPRKECYLPGSRQGHDQDFVDRCCRLGSTTGYRSGQTEPILGSIGAYEIHVYRFCLQILGFSSCARL